MSKRERGIMTKAVQSGWKSDPATGAFALPIYETAGFDFHDTARAAGLFALEESGYIYSRLGNPTVAAFETALADMEGGVAAVATASGQAAFSMLVMALARPGDHIVAASSSYGGTLTLLKNLFGRYGVEAEFVDINHPCNVQNALRDETCAIICEVVGNPAMNVAPLETLAGLAKRNGIPLIVDNTFTPIVCRPIEWGADVVVHSTTKYISGLGTVVGGAVVDSGNFDWNSDERWSDFNKPDPAYHDVVFTERFGRAALAARIRLSVMRDVGAIAHPFEAFLLRQSLTTLPLRMKRHSENALSVAEFLESHAAVANVSYPGLKSHPQNYMAERYLAEGCSGMMAVTLKGGYAGGVRFMDALEIFSIVANVGDSRSMAVHPASTTHAQLSPAERAAAGLDEGLIRLSIGLEDPVDLIDDLTSALAAAQGA